MRGLFVTGTGTGVGKTIVSAALLASMAAAGETVRAHKPVVTGLEEQNGSWPADHELLAAVAHMTPEQVAPLRYEPAVSPHLAARLAGERIDPCGLIERARTMGRAAPAVEPALIVEGVGGLLTPLSDDFTVRDLALELELGTIVVANPGLGTINHTLLSLEAARSVSLLVCAVVLTPWPEIPSHMEGSNRETIERIGHIEVATMGAIRNSDPEELARGGDELPWRRWLS